MPGRGQNKHPDLWLDENLGSDIDEGSGLIFNKGLRGRQDVDVSIQQTAARIEHSQLAIDAFERRTQALARETKDWVPKTCSRCWFKFEIIVLDQISSRHSINFAIFYCDPEAAAMLLDHQDKLFGTPLPDE